MSSGGGTGRKDGGEGKENNFKIIRLLAAFLVLTGHAYILTGPPAPVLLFSATQRLGIIIFFTVGGYLITESWERDPHYIRYLIKRIFRIFPALIACIFLTVFVFGPVLSTRTIRQYFSDRSVWDYLKNIFLYVTYTLPGVFNENPVSSVINGSLWSLPVEFFMYLLIPLLCTAGKKAGRAVPVLLTVFMCALSSYRHIVRPEWRLVIYGVDLGQALEVVPYYLIGNVAASVKQKKLWNLQVAWLFLFFCQSLAISDAWGSVLSFAVVPYIVFSFAFVERPIGIRKKYRWTEISYGLYLYGFFVQQFIIERMLRRGISLQANQVIALSLLVAGVMAWISANLIEKPAQKASKKLLLKIGR